jgi:micrococcal nuclease
LPGVLARLAPWILALAALAGVVLVRPGRRGDDNQGAGARAAARITRVVDGDTIVARLAGGARDRVRYIGIDTPEDVRPGSPVACFSRRAAARNAQLVAGRDVLLRFDRERRDRYGRLLAYVYRRSDALFVNARLVAEGFARDLRYPPNLAHAGELRRLREAAQHARRGLWGACAAGGSAAFQGS